MKTELFRLDFFGLGIFAPDPDPLRKSTKRIRRVTALRFRDCRVRLALMVNVCPASVTRASPDRLWSVLSAPERFGEWTDATYLSSDPVGPVKPGQTIHLTARSFGRNWPVEIAVNDVDAQHRWIDLVVHLPFGIDNHEHLTLTETAEGGTLVRFN